MSHCFHCGRAVEDTDPSIVIMVVESHSGRLGTARLHDQCCDQSLARYRQTVTWDGSTTSNLNAFKRLHGRIAAMNDASWGGVIVVVT
jgi:hypothetical protein